MVGAHQKLYYWLKVFLEWSLNKLVKLKGITIESRFKATKTSFDELFTEEVNIPLTDAQQAVYEPIQEVMNTSSA